MRKSIVLSITMCAAFTANADLDGAGYYRVRNLKTERWVSVIDNYGRIDYGNTTADLQAIKLQKNFDVVCSDPASVLYIYSVGNKYQLETQGTGIEQIIGHHADLTVNGSSGGEKTYLCSGTYEGFTKYLGDGKFFPGDIGAMATNTSSDYRRWFIRQITNDGENFFGVMPALEVDGKYYTTMYGGFPFSAYSDGVKAYYVSGIHEDMVCLEEINGVVAASTPVVMECAGDSPSSNRLHVGGKGATLRGNLLKGVYFCNWEVGPTSRHYNVTEYNPVTMRVLGTLADGSLGFVTDPELEFIPANSCYLSVPEGSPAEFRCVDKEEFLAGVDPVNVKDADHATSDVYNMQGVMLIRNATQEQISALPRGLYIIGGKKIRK